MLLFLHVSVLLCCVIVSAYGEVCKDIDPSACQLMSQTKPDICSDMAIAKTACPQFCNLCPLVCYHCNATVRDYHQCRTNMTCQEGQICMIKELKSIFDGHHEYEMTCAEKQACDNPWNGAGAFGRRNVVSRDLTVSCCMNDMCNYPSSKPTTSKPATSCVKDLIFAVDETNKLHKDEATVMQFLYDIVNSLPVNDADVHVALGLFSDSFRSIFDLNELTSKSETLMALRRQTLKGTHGGDSTEGLNYILNHALTPAAGDRPEAPNVVVFITAHGTEHISKIRVQENQVHSKAEVIAVEIGQSVFHLLATGDDHDFDVSSARHLLQIVQNVTNLIC